MITLAIGIIASSHLKAVPNPTFLNWTVPATGSSVLARTPLPLRNLGNGQYLVFDSKATPVKLRFIPTAAPRIAFFGTTPTMTKVRFGDRVAVQVAGGGFLRFELRPRGLDLAVGSFDASWYVIGDAEFGADVQPNMSFGLLNLRNKDFLIFQDQPSGIDLIWRKQSNAPYAEGYVFTRSLREKGFTKMAALLNSLLKW